MNNEHLFLASEISELKDLIAATPEEDVIDRMSLEARLRVVQNRLAGLPQIRQAPTARLTFKGKPVVGGHGIAADFGTKAASAFAEAFAVVAAGLDEDLRQSGPIPNREKNQLLITGTAIGSFGFEFELPAPDATLFPELEPAEQAMRKIENLFRLTAEGSDDDIAEALDDVHPRAVRKVHEFLDLLVQQEAWCGLEFGGRTFRYEGYEQIKRSSSRLRDDNFREHEESCRGEFQGVLPTGRTFEFKRQDQEGLIRGKIDAAFADPDVLNREWLHRPATVKLKVRHVGQGRPRYTLMSLDDVQALETPKA